MTKRDSLVALQQMRDHASEAYRLVSGKTREALSSRLLELALLRLLEITGEAAGRVPEEIQERYSAIPWRQIIGLRNRLIHGYDAVDLDVVWRIVTSDIPELLPHLESAIDTESADS